MRFGYGKTDQGVAFEDVLEHFDAVHGFSLRDLDFFEKLFLMGSQNVNIFDILAGFPDAGPFKTRLRPAEGVIEHQD
jgi:hypothetical protein